MWPRWLELGLGAWLLMSPAVFGHFPAEPLLWATDFIAGASIIALALLSHRRGWSRAHLGSAGVALWLYVQRQIFGGYPALPGFENHAVVALFLALVALMPSPTNQPPAAWERFYARRSPRPAD